MLRRVGCRLTVVVMLLSPGALIPTAQAQRVSGQVYDSLATGGYLGHATLWIAGTGLQTSTDAAGHFQFDSVPPGSHQIALDHPVFDSLGLSPTTWWIEIPSAGRDDLLLAVPSAARTLGLHCETPPKVGAGFVFGWVTDPGTDRALAGVRVHACWSEVTVSTTAVQVWRYRRGTSDSAITSSATCRESRAASWYGPRWTPRPPDSSWSSSAQPGRPEGPCCFHPARTPGAGLKERYGTLTVLLLLARAFWCAGARG